MHLDKLMIPLVSRLGSCFRGALKAVCCCCRVSGQVSSQPGQRAATQAQAHHLTVLYVCVQLAK